MIEPLFVGGPEVLWIMLALLFLLIGPKRIPEIARALGRAMGELQKGRREFEQEFRGEAKALTEVEPDLPAARRRYRLVKVARTLNIDVAGKNEDQLQKEIDAALATDESSRTQAPQGSTAAQVPSSNSPQAGATKTDSSGAETSDREAGKSGAEGS